MAHAAFGRLPLKRCLESAIGYARDGFPVTARLAHWRELAREELARSPEAAAIFLKDGAVLTNPDLARTLEAIASDGWYGFYDGRGGARAGALVDGQRRLLHPGRSQGAGRALGRAAQGQLSRRHDLRNAGADQGFAVLEMLNLLEPLELHRKPFLGPDCRASHGAGQAARLSRPRPPSRRSALRRRADGAPDLQGLRRRTARPDGSRRAPCRGTAFPSYGSLAGDTVYIAVVDADGQRGLADPLALRRLRRRRRGGRTGVVLQNRSAYFSLDPKSPNRVEPGKTPLHTLIASMAFRDDKLWAVVGCMGADGQPQIHLQTYLAMIDHGCDIQQALDTPRFLSGRFAIGEPRDTLHIEARFPPETVAELERRGHLLNRWGAVERTRGPRPRHHDRSRERPARGRRRPAQRRRRDRVLSQALRSAKPS